MATKKTTTISATGAAIAETLPPFDSQHSGEETDIGTTVALKLKDNADTLTKFGESDGQPTFENQPIVSSSTWGNITGDINNQADLMAAIVSGGASADFYVSASDGSDESGDGTKDAPWRTIQKATEYATNSSDILGTAIIHIADGIYPLKSTIKIEHPKSASGIILRGNVANPENVVIALGSDYVIDSPQIFGLYIFQAIVSIEGIKFRYADNAIFSAGYILIYPFCAEMFLRNCISEINDTINSVSYHISTARGSRVHMENVIFTGTACTHVVACITESLVTFGNVTFDNIQKVTSLIRAYDRGRFAIMQHPASGSFGIKGTYTTVGKKYELTNGASLARISHFTANATIAGTTDATSSVF